MESRRGFVWLFSVSLICILTHKEAEGIEIGRRSAIPPRDIEDYPDYPLLGVRYDEYPVSLFVFFFLLESWDIQIPR